MLPIVSGVPTVLFLTQHWQYVNPSICLSLCFLYSVIPNLSMTRYWMAWLVTATSFVVNLVLAIWRLQTILNMLSQWCISIMRRQWSAITPTDIGNAWLHFPPYILSTPYVFVPCIAIIPHTLYSVLYVLCVVNVLQKCFWFCEVCMQEVYINSNTLNFLILFTYYG